MTDESADERAHAIYDPIVGARMAMREHPMKEWAVIELDAAPHWSLLIAEAHAFVDSITP